MNQINNQTTNDTASTIYQLRPDEEIRLKCQARADYYLRQRATIARINRMKEQFEAQKHLYTQEEIEATEKEFAAIEEGYGITKEKIDIKQEMCDFLSKQITIKHSEIAYLQEELALIMAQ